MQKLIDNIKILLFVALLVPDFALAEDCKIVYRRAMPLKMTDLKLSGVVKLGSGLSGNCNNKLFFSKYHSVEFTLNGKFNILNNAHLIFKVTSNTNKQDGFGYQQAFVGVTGIFGSIYIGKVFTVSRLNSSIFEINLFSRIGGYYRYNNAITYKFPSINGFIGTIQATINSNDTNILDLGLRYTGINNVFLSVGFVQGTNEPYKSQRFYHIPQVFRVKNKTSLKQKDTLGETGQKDTISTRTSYVVSKYIHIIDDNNKLYLILGYKHNKFVTNIFYVKELYLDQVALRLGYNFSQYYDISLGYLRYTPYIGQNQDRSKVHTVMPVNSILLNWEMSLAKNISWGIYTSYIWWHKQTTGNIPLGRFAIENNKLVNSIRVSTDLKMFF